jgi:hypothetical protein
VATGDDGGATLSRRPGRGRSREEYVVTDEPAEDPGSAEEVERRRLIDLTRPEKGLPERRNLRRVRHQPLWIFPEDQEPEADQPGDGDAGPGGQAT